MDLRLLGRTGVRVSALSLGTYTFGPNPDGIGSTTAEDAKELVAVAIDAGVNLFDTADVYADGLSEETLGAALRGRRDEVLVATKCHFRRGAGEGGTVRLASGPNEVGSSRHHIVRSCEASLRRLGTDWIDLLQLHAVDELTDVDQTLRALDDLVRAGKVRYVGCSNYSAWHLMKALGVADFRGLERFASLQAYYNLVARELEHELIPLCLDQGVGVLVWGPLASGLLARSPASRPHPQTRLATYGPEGTVDVESATLVVSTMAEIAADRDVSLSQVALNWLLAKRAVSSVIVGARNREQLAENLAAATWELGPGELQRLDDVSQRPLPYPYFHQVNENSERMR